ncbi:MAG: hypothetical protein ACMUHB_00415, partial [Thermoplasmatota archaeon]
REIEILKTFENEGLNIDGMEELLFTDIETYRQKRADLLFSLEVEREPLFDDDLLVFGPDDEPEEELLLYGAPPVEDESMTEFPSDMIGEESHQMERKMDVQGQQAQIDSKPKKETTPAPTGIPGKGVEGSAPRSDVSIVPEKTKKVEKLSSKEQGLGKRGFVAIFVVLIILFIGTSGSYLLFLRNGSDENGDTPLTAEFSVSEIHPIAGDIVNLTGKMERMEGGVTYQWSIQPADYTVVKGNLRSRSVELYFREMGNFRVDLKTARGGDEETFNLYMDVSNRDVIIERERYGDVGSYDLDGNLHLENIDELLGSRETYDYDTLDVRFFTDENNPMETSILDRREKGMDGLGSQYQKLTRKTDQFIRFSGTVTGQESQSAGISGNSRTVQSNDIDLFNKRPFRTQTDVVSHFVIPVKDGITWEYDVAESVTLFPDLTQEGSDLRIEDIAEGRTLSLEDQGIAKWGKYDLSWETRQVQRIGGRTAIMVEFFMDPATKNELDIDEFSMLQWIADDIPVPVRVMTNITSSNDILHPYVLDFDQILVDFTGGSDVVIYGSVDHRHDSIAYIYEKTGMEELSSEFHSNWAMIPDTGNMATSIPLDFLPGDALDTAINDQNFKLWSANKPDILVIGSNITKVGGLDKWTFILAEPDEEGGWESKVIGSNAQGIPSKVLPVDIGRPDIGSVMTYSGAEYVLKKLLPDMDQDSTTRIYGKSQPANEDKIRFTELSMGTRVDSPYPRSGFVDPSLSGSIEYCLIIEALDGSLEVGLDMENGQLAYIRTTSVQSS